MRRVARIRLACLAVTLVLALPSGRARATSVYGSTVLGGITFDVGTNGCLGPVVGVYGAEEFGTWIQAAAQAYCDAQLASGTSFDSAVDVEYVPATDCTAADLAASDRTEDVIGLTAVFPGACSYTGIAGGSGNIAPDQTQGLPGLAVNVVEAITHCSGAATPQGGAPAGYALSGTPCLGRAPISASAMLDMLSGCPAALAHVCSTTTGPFAPIDAEGTIGYAPRANLLVDPRDSSGALRTVQNLGIIALGGQTGWNGTCDATLVASGGQPNAGVNAEDGVPTCNGDLQVVNGSYVAFGFVHGYLNAAAIAAGTNPFAQEFMTYLTSDADNAPTVQAMEQAYGLLPNCEMQVERAIDGGPLSATAGATC